jgi:hypothetical protein
MESMILASKSIDAHSVERLIFHLLKLNFLLSKKKKISTFLFAPAFRRRRTLFCWQHKSLQQPPS